MINKINCLVIDDEPLARKGLKEYIADVDFLSLAGEFEHPLKAIPSINKNIQLLFLDIQMPKINGIELFKTLQDPPPVIFTTAYPQYALDGFELNALDYLVKPFSFERFYKAALRAKDYYEYREKNIAVNDGDAHDHFFIKADSKLVKIAYNDILYIEALQNYVTIHTTGKKYITYLTLHSLQEHLPPNMFIKCHKSFIISAAKINSIDGNEIIIGTNHIPISRSNKDEVMEVLLKGRYLKR